MNSIAAALIAACVQTQAAAYHVPEPIVWTLLKVEGGAVGVVSPNSNGSEDYGPMQVNSTWLTKLSDYYGKPKNELRERLIHDACFNIGVGNWILKTEMVRAGERNFWDGVGHYHSRTGKHKARYLNRVTNAALDLYGPAIFANGVASPRPIQLEKIPAIAKAK